MTLQVSEKNFTILTPSKASQDEVEMIGTGKYNGLSWTFDSCKYGSTLRISGNGEKKIENPMHIKDVATAVVWVSFQLNRD